MSRWDKLIKRILSLSNDLRFDELRRILESYGYTMSAPITIPKHEPIKKVYVLMVKEVIESEAKNNEDS